MTPQQATAEVFYTAFKALSKQEQENVLARIARDRKLRRILLQDRAEGICGRVVLKSAFTAEHFVQNDAE